MNNEKIFYCNECGEELECLGYNYETGNVDYECPNCGEFYTNLDDDYDEDEEDF